MSLVGTQEVTIDSHGTDGRPGSHITVAYVGAMIWLYDLRAVRTYSKIWNEGIARIYAEQLPEIRLLTHTETEFPMTIGIRAAAGDEPDLIPRHECLIVKIGNVNWAVYDRAAFQHQMATWTRVTQLAEPVLPRVHNPRLRTGR